MELVYLLPTAAIKSDDDDEGLAEGLDTQGEGSKEVLPELSDDENDEAARRDGQGGWVVLVVVAVRLVERGVAPERYKLTSQEDGGGGNCT